MRTIRIHADAADEAERAFNWYERERAGLGDEFVEALDTALDILEWDQIPSVPASGEAAGRGVRRIILKRFPFDVVYVERGDHIWVLAFAHHSRRPGYWQARLRS